jgi:hypothetical protein
MKIRLLPPNVITKVWVIVLSTLGISFGFLAAPLQAQFAFVVNLNANTVSGYSIDRKDRGSSAYPRLSIANGGQSPVGSYITPH